MTKKLEETDFEVVLQWTIAEKVVVRAKTQRAAGELACSTRSSPSGYMEDWVMGMLGPIPILVEEK